MRLNRVLIAGVLGLMVVAPSFADDGIENPASNVAVSKTAPVVAKKIENSAKTEKHTKTEKTGNAVNINTASAQDIAKSLSGVGKKRAEAIVEYRTKNGPFKSVDDLTNIKGISKKVLEKNTGKILLS